jgi:hypothetical protein
MNNKNDLKILARLDHEIASHPTEVKGMLISPEIRKIMIKSKKFVVVNLPGPCGDEKIIDAVISATGRPYSKRITIPFEAYQYVTPSKDIQNIWITVGDLNGYEYILPKA